jgi:hypothetical protein
VYAIPAEGLDCPPATVFHANLPDFKPLEA